jgi:hypothetical protein
LRSTCKLACRRGERHHQKSTDCCTDMVPVTVAEKNRPVRGRKMGLRVKASVARLKASYLAECEALCHTSH